MEAEKCAKHEEGQSTCRAPLENRRKKKEKKKEYILGTYWQQGGTDSGRKIFMGIGKRHFLKSNNLHKICSYI